MRRTSALLEIERRHVQNTLHSCGNNRSLAAKVVGLFVRILRIKPQQKQEPDFALPVHADGELCGEVNVGKSAQGREFPQDDNATINVIEELISVVEAMAESARPHDLHGGRMTSRRERT